jgi:hypothetical protein
MAIYIGPNEQYPRYVGDIILENRLWSFGDQLPDGWAEVEESEVPEQRPGYTMVEDFPNFVDGKYIRSWSFIKKTDEQIEKEQQHQQELFQRKNGLVL